jgi:hypothetical protein
MQDQSPYQVPLSAQLITVTATAGTAVGSTDTIVVIFTTINDPANAFVSSASATLGSAFGCVNPGIWQIEFFAALAAAGDLNIGISLNAARVGALTTSPTDFVVVDAGGGTEGIIGLSGFLSATAADLPLLQCSRTLRLAFGDVLRFVVTAGVTLDTDNLRLFMTKLSP